MPVDIDRNLLHFSVFALGYKARQTLTKRIDMIWDMEHMMCFRLKLIFTISSGESVMMQLDELPQLRSVSGHLAWR